MRPSLPWWARIGAKMLLARLPMGYGLWRKVGLFRHGAMDQSGYAIDVFNAHMRQAGVDGSLRGRVLLELGPGDSVATAVIAAAHGATAWLVDAGAFVREDLAPYRRLAAVLAEQGLQPPDLEACRDLADLLRVCGARYFSGGLEDLRQLPAAHFDVVFSQAVLEHVRRHEFLETMRATVRALRPGGCASHRVDLKDHLGGALNNLRFTEAAWESPLFVNSGFYTNRLRYREMLSLFEQAGFTVLSSTPTRWAGLPTTRQALAQPFQSMTDEELCVAGFDVVLGLTAESRDRCQLA